METIEVTVYEEGGERVAFLTAFEHDDPLARLFRERFELLQHLDGACWECRYRATPRCPSLGGEGPCYLDEISARLKDVEREIARVLRDIMIHYRVKRVWGLGFVDDYEISFHSDYPPVSYWLSQ